jgi:hypothetical protein
MTITAKYASRCPDCGDSIHVGAQIEWKKGAPARHAACAGTGGTKSERAFSRARRRDDAAGAARANSRCPNPRDCGDPSCDGNCGY